MPWKSVNQWNGSNNSGLIVIVRLCLVTVFIGNMEPVDVAKVAAMFILSLLPILLGVVPIFIVSRMKLMPNKNGLSNTAKLVTTCFSCFSGGVLIATALLHLLPEIQEGFTDLNTDQVLVTDLPMAEIMLCCGFFLVYLIEELVHYYADRHAHTRVDATLHRSFSIRGCSISHEGASDGSPAVNNGTTDTADSIRRKKMAAHDFSIKIETENAEKTEKAAAAPAMNAHHSHGLPGAGGKTLPALANFLIVLGLSFHAVFEGIACGLEKTDAEVWQLTAAIASHKLVIAFCIGLDMAINGVRVSLHVSYMVLFGLVTPLGIGIGMALTYGQSSVEVTDVVLAGLATGTLVYVAFFEILERERSKDNSRLLQWCLILIGFLAMLGLETLVGHEHNHDHGIEPELEHEHEHDHDHDHDHDHEHEHLLAVLNSTVLALANHH